jgi:protein-tyrosine-phosphatase/glycosyltransferase involved in cell wall biosynthesis
MISNIDFRKTLFVCTGNVFRSVVAEKLFLQNILKQNLPFQVRSRGTNPYFKTPHPLLCDIVEQKYSITLKGHMAKKLYLEDILWASVIFCFTPEHRQSVIKMCPSAKDKTFLIYDVVPLGPCSFQDIDYYDVSKTNEQLFKELEAIKLAIDKLLRPVSLSIVMAVYNEEKTIGNILTKLVTQSLYQGVKEIIVVSSGSTDRTNDIINSIQSPLINLLQEKTRNGKVSALKKAANVVSGDYVLLIDGDVDIEDNFIKECFYCIYNRRAPCTGKIIPTSIKNKFFYEISVVNCEAWNSLRKKYDRTNVFLYPSGYTMLLSREDFVEGIRNINETTVNDDGVLALMLSQKGVLFHYCDNLRVYVTFPQTFRDFFKQKIRTRIGRRQIASHFFKKIEKQWRHELIRLININNFIFIIVLIIMDSIARFVANIKIKLNSEHHLWEPVESTKEIQNYNQC